MAAKKQISVYIDEELLYWIDTMVKKKFFANRNHALTMCVMTTKKLLTENEANLQEIGGQIAEMIQHVLDEQLPRVRQAVFDEIRRTLGETIPRVRELARSVAEKEPRDQGSTQQNL